MALEREPDNVDYRYEENRLQSFENWPLPFVEPSALAAAGFYYVQSENHACCFDCTIRIYNWKEDDDPLTKHYRYSRECRFIHDVPCGNVPINPPETPKCTGPRHPEYIKYKDRLRTFQEWPSHLRYTPEMLAEAGFYYIGPETQVKCFYCDRVFKKWEDVIDEDVWTRHASWFPKCLFVRVKKNY